MTTVRFVDSDGKFLFKIKYIKNGFRITSPLKVVYQEEPLEKLLEKILHFTSPSSEMYQQILSIFEEDFRILKEEDDEESMEMDELD